MLKMMTSKFLFALFCDYIGFQLSVESNWSFALIWFYISIPCDWFVKTRATFSTNKKQTKPIVVCSHTFSRAWLYVFAWSSDWFITLFTFVLIGQSNYFGSGFMTLKFKPF